MAFSVNYPSMEDDSKSHDQPINGNPLNLDIEKISNVPGKYFKRKVSSNLRMMYIVPT